MVDKYMYFIQLAKDLNITQAAEKLYLSQQSLSTYLKKLEDSYDVVLFNRKPRLSLTPAGEAVLRAYKKIDFVEKDLQLELESIKSGETGRIMLGIHSARSTILLPTIFAEFAEKYPKITFNIIDGVTTNFEEMLLNGDLDFFIGREPKNSGAFKYIPLVREKTYLIISDTLLMKYFPDEYPSCKDRFKNGVNLTEFTGVPFLFQGTTSRVAQDLDAYQREHDITLYKRISSNNGELRIALSGLNLGASFTTQMRFSTVETYNRNHPESYLNMFPVNGINDNISSSYIVYNKRSYHPPYMEYFLELVLRHFEETYK